MPDKNPFSVSPCLFIGIGTNGWRILQELRELIYEEFGRGGLPCFRYIGIESDSDKKPDDSFLPHRPEAYERVTPVYISIPDVNVIRRRLDPAMGQDAILSMGDWLDGRLIERGNKSYKAGAGNARQAGRMCLWENWKQFRSAVSDGLDAIRNPDGREAADTFLRKEYFAKKRALSQPPAERLVKDAPKIYIFGTLCGGTCSGTFMDIAYYVAHELGLLGDVRRGIQRGVADPEIVGLFTITDMRRIADGELRKLVANCWAALRELDFAYHKEGRYTATFPDGTEIDTPNEPFDTLYLQSLSNLAAKGFDRSDYDGLAQMCAMNLFTEVVAGLAAKKDESRVNLHQTAEGYMQPNPQEHMRAFSAFGLSAFWYPKYRIAQAINRQLTVEMTGGWLGTAVTSSTMADEARKDWQDLLGGVRDSLIGKGVNARCNLNLEDEIQHAFDHGEPSFLQTDEFGLDSLLVSVPGPVSFAERLAGPAGDYFTRVADAEPFVAGDLRNALKATIERFFRGHTCAETKAYVDALVQLAASETDKLPGELAPLSQRMDVGLAREVHHGWWARSLGLQRDAVEEYKRILWRDLRQRVLGHLSHLQAYFLRQVLAKSRVDVANLQNQVAQAESRLRLLRETCGREKQEIIGFKPPGHIVILAAGESNTIAEDVDLGWRQVTKEVDRDALRRLFVADAEPLTLLTTTTEEQLKSRADLYFGPYSQNITASFQIGKKVLAVSRNRVPDLVDRAAPYIEAVSSFRPLSTKDTPNFLFCAEPEVGEELVRTVNELLKDSRYAPAFSPLDHFVFFYHEAVGVALSDLAIATRAHALLGELERDPARIATNYTHKLGEKRFNFRLVRDAHLTMRWIGCLKYLAPDLFRPIGKDLCLEYRTPDGLMKALPVDNPDAVRQYLEDQGSDQLIKRFVTRLQELGQNPVMERMETRRKQAQSLSEMETVTSTHATILRAAFPGQQPG